MHWNWRSLWNEDSEPATLDTAAFDLLLFRLDSAGCLELMLKIAWEGLEHIAIDLSPLVEMRAHARRVESCNLNWLYDASVLGCDRLPIEESCAEL